MRHNGNFYDELLVSPAVEALVMVPTKAIAAQARATAPVASREYQNGIRATSKKQKRVVGIVESSDEKTMIIEARTGNMVRALRSVGRGK